MPRRSIVLAGLALLGALLAGCAAPGSSGRRSTSEARGGGNGAGRGGDRAGDRAPDFTVTTFTGDSFALGEQKGTPVVLNFWESW